VSEQLQFHPIADLFPAAGGRGVRHARRRHQGERPAREDRSIPRQDCRCRNRYRALLQLGIDPKPGPDPKYFRNAIYTHSVGGDIAPHEQDNDARVRAYVISKNIHRRHLTPEQKRDLIAKVIAAKPEASDRQIAKQVKADHKTVGAVRKAKEATGEVSPVEKRVGADGKARKQPAPVKVHMKVLPQDPTPVKVCLTVVDPAQPKSEPEAEPAPKLNAVGKPYSPQFDPNYKMRKLAPVKAPHGRRDVIQDMLGVLSGLNKSRRADFFTTLWDKYRDELIAAQTVPPKSASVNSADFVLDMILPEGNGADPEASAESMKAQIAALDNPEATA
jgi:hypothetical protein